MLESADSGGPWEKQDAYVALWTLMNPLIA